jgi:hypothetical protein
MQMVSLFAIATYKIRERHALPPTAHNNTGTLAATSDAQIAISSTLLLYVPKHFWSASHLERGQLPPAHIVRCATIPQDPRPAELRNTKRLTDPVVVLWLVAQAQQKPSGLWRCHTAGTLSMLLRTPAW